MAESLITLRAIQLEDLDFLWGWMHDTPGAEWKRWNGPYFGQDPAPARQDFDASAMRRSEAGTWRMVDVDGDPVGIVTRGEEAPQGGGWWDVGILVFDPARWGRGIGQQALARWTDLTFEETDAHVITVTTWSGNERMVRSALRAGFIQCARIPEARAWDGRRWDSVKLARLRTEGSSWRRRRSDPVPCEGDGLRGTLPE